MDRTHYEFRLYKFKEYSHYILEPANSWIYRKSSTGLSPPDMSIWVAREILYVRIDLLQWLHAVFICDSVSSGYQGSWRHRPNQARTWSHGHTWLVTWLRRISLLETTLRYVSSSRMWERFKYMPHDQNHDIHRQDSPYSIRVHCKALPLCDLTSTNRNVPSWVSSFPSLISFVISTRSSHSLPWFE